MSKRVLLGGGRGFLGCAITKHLQKKGYEVTILSRTADESKGILSWDNFEDKLTVKPDAVINLSGAPILDMKTLWTDKYMKECETSRIDTTKKLVEVFASSDSKLKQPEVMIATSAVGYYPTSLTSTYTEPYIGSTSTDGWAASLCHKIEDAIVPAEKMGIRTVAMRMGVILGRGGGAYDNMRVPFRLGLGGAFGDGKQWFPWIHLDDAARMYAFAIENPKIQGPLNAVSPGCVTNGAFTGALASAMWRPALANVPGFALTLLGKERAAMLLEGQRVLPDKALQNGFEFEYPTVAECCNELVNGSD
ncbi:hypothetical protein AAMO2058_000224000 [Amorphochlora amoebiformis]